MASWFCRFLYVQFLNLFNLLKTYGDFYLMKKLIFLLLIVLLLAACGGQAEPQVETPAEEPAEAVTLPDTIDEEEEDVERLNVIATIFPQYDFIRRIAGDRVDRTMLLSPGAEAHSFEPTPQDIIRLQDADLFVYIGGHGERWVDTILNAVLEENDMRVVVLLDMVETIEADHDHDHDHGHTHDHSHDHDDHAHSHSHDHDDDDHAHVHSHDHDDDYAHDHHHEAVEL